MRKIPHISEEDLALLIEGKLAPHRALPLREHIAGCKVCYQDFIDAMRMRMEWLANAGAMSVPAEVREAGRSVRLSEERRSAEAQDAAREPTAGPASRFGRTRLLRFAAGSGGTLAVAAVVLWLVLAPWSQRSPGLLEYPELLEEIRHDSSQGMVIPGGEAAADVNLPVERGIGLVTESIFKTLSELTMRFAEGDRSADMYYFLSAGFLVTDQLGLARIYAERGSTNYPEDPRLAGLQAIVAYRESQTAESESILRRLVETDPGDLLAALNLGILLSEERRMKEARTLLLSVRDADPDSPMARRAERIVENLAQGL